MTALGGPPGQQPLFLIEEGELTSLTDDPSTAMSKLLFKHGYQRFKSLKGKSQAFKAFSPAQNLDADNAFDNYLYVPQAHLERVRLAGGT